MDEHKVDQLLAGLAKRSSVPPDFVLLRPTTDESFIEEIKKEATSADLAENEWVQIQERAKTRGFSFLLVGRAGVGKSSTINSLMGREVAPVGEFEAETKVVKAYPAPSNAIIPYRIYDTPGLCDADGDNEEYLSLIRAEIKDPIDCLWFVTQLDDTRIRTDEIDTIRHTTSAFGREIWKRAVIVFTRADKVEPKDFERYLSERTRLIRDQIAKEIGQEIALEIPSVAVTNKGSKTPDGKPWLGRLFARTFVRISEEGLDGFLLEIVNWRGLCLETDKSEEGQSSYQGIHRHYYTNIYNETYVSHPPPSPAGPIPMTRDDIKTIEDRGKNWMRKVGRKVGEVVGEALGRTIAGDLGGNLGHNLGGNIGEEIGEEVVTVVSSAVKQGAEAVAKVAEEGGKLVRNAWNGFKSIFG